MTNPADANFIAKELVELFQVKGYLDITEIVIVHVTPKRPLPEIQIIYDRYDRYLTGEFDEGDLYLDETEMVKIHSEKHKKPRLLDYFGFKMVGFHSDFRSAINGTTFFADIQWELSKKFPALLLKRGVCIDQDAAGTKFDACMSFGDGKTLILLNDPRSSLIEYALEGKSFERIQGEILSINTQALPDMEE